MTLNLGTTSTVSFYVFFSVWGWGNGGGEVVGWGKSRGGGLCRSVEYNVRKRRFNTWNSLGPLLGRTDILEDFYFWSRRIFRGFCRRIFSPQFCQKKCPEESSSKIPGKIFQNCTTKIPDGRAKNSFCSPSSGVSHSNSLEEELRRP